MSIVSTGVGDHPGIRCTGSFFYLFLGIRSFQWPNGLPALMLISCAEIDGGVMRSAIASLESERLDGVDGSDEGEQACHGMGLRAALFDLRRSGGGPPGNTVQWSCFPLRRRLCPTGGECPGSESVSAGRGSGIFRPVLFESVECQRMRPKLTPQSRTS